MAGNLDKQTRTPVLRLKTCVCLPRQRLLKLLLFLSLYFISLTVISSFPWFLSKWCALDNFSRRHIIVERNLLLLSDLIPFLFFNDY